MTTVHHEVSATPEQVWAVLADPYRYPDWVVGARRIRGADDTWPDPGAVLHHELSRFPAMGIEDSTTVLESERPHRLVLRARARPAGVARVVITVAAAGEGARIEMEEKAVEGPASLVPERILARLLRSRNAESLRRLGELAQRGTS